MKFRKIAKAVNILPKWRNFAKSCHTDELRLVEAKL